MYVYDIRACLCACCLRARAGGWASVHTFAHTGVRACGHVCELTAMIMLTCKHVGALSC